MLEKVETLEAVAVDADFLSAPPPPGRSVADLDVAGPERFINRELSWLAFNWRVMAEAESPAVPLLERVRFLSISASNLDEFYSVRVAGLRGLVRAGVHAPSTDGLSPSEQLRRIDAGARALMMRQQEALDALERAMRAEGIEILRPRDLKGADLKAMEAHFFEQVCPLLSPLASRMQWQEQLSETASVAEPEHEIKVIPSPSIQLPVPSGEMAYAELVTSIKLPTGEPTTGGVIR